MKRLLLVLLLLSACSEKNKYGYVEVPSAEKAAMEAAQKAKEAPLDAKEAYAISNREMLKYVFKWIRQTAESDGETKVSIEKYDCKRMRLFISQLGFSLKQTKERKPETTECTNYYSASSNHCFKIPAKVIDACLISWEATQ